MELRSWCWPLQHSRWVYGSEAGLGLLVRAEMKHFSHRSWGSDAGSSPDVAALSVWLNKLLLVFAGVKVIHSQQAYCWSCRNVLLIRSWEYLPLWLSVLGRVLEADQPRLPTVFQNNQVIFYTIKFKVQKWLEKKRKEKISTMQKY